MDKHIAVLEELAREFCDDDLPELVHLFPEHIAAIRAAIALMRGQSWQPIETAPKGDNTVLSPAVLLGYAPDETGYSPRTVEGHWNHEDGRWNWSNDPNFSCPQPTHWQPLPAPPKDPADEQ